MRCLFKFQVGTYHILHWCWSSLRSHPAQIPIKHFRSIWINSSPKSARFSVSPSTLSLCRGWIDVQTGSQRRSATDTRTLLHFFDRTSPFVFLCRRRCKESGTNFPHFSRKILGQKFVVAFYCGQQLQMKVRLSETLFWPISARAQALRKQAATSTEAELTSAWVKGCLHKQYFLLQNNDITIISFGCWACFEIDWKSNSSCTFAAINGKLPIAG